MGKTVKYEVIIGMRGYDKYGNDAFRYDTFIITIDKTEDDDKHTWYDEWEGGGEELRLPNSKTANAEHIETEGVEEMEKMEEAWTESFEEV